ncbi:MULTISPECIES: OBAP family protein [unclassified Luteimonas]|uniref:OBAP family protein n=1 Tax=unclassified Luteimonas TaxID=2629088 RepID=UPI0018F09A5D|nr:MULTISPECIES: OBAP family protein [unclassified Luteimonas]MBJ6978359.1 OBAP family protein [Luteimonas sp. MC1895]MBJ6983859.1 OBAP family protein [Luteimonas sp. MC1750]QQO06679.1 OBAP family protein [Luteimonas sp. MC1750]
MDRSRRFQAGPTGLLLALSLAACTGDGEVPSPEPAGAPKAPGTAVLETGARALQDTAPVEALDMHLIGFHPMKDAPHIQMEAHHFCRQVNEDFAQCALFDGNGADANLNGVEYIISEAAFERLPQEERAYWHPHNAEILSGQLVAPGIPEAAEHALMRQKINSYGKTWHTWNTRHGVEPGDALPLGPAALAWSFNRDGELDPALLAERDRRMDIDTGERRESRRELRDLARPQSGVDALREHFPKATPIDGVQEAQQAVGGHADARPAAAGQPNGRPDALIR